MEHLSLDPGGSAGKKSACSAGDLGLIPGLGRSPGDGKGYPLQCAGLENPVDCTVQGGPRLGHNGVTFTLTLLLSLFTLHLVLHPVPARLSRGTSISPCEPTTADLFIHFLKNVWAVSNLGK